MTGLQLEQIFQKKSIKKVDVAEALGMSLQNFCAVFRVQDVKSGIIEKISAATGISIAEIYGEVAYCVNNSEGNTQVGNGNTINTTHDKLIDSLAKKDEQIDRLLSIIERLQHQSAETTI